MFEVYFQRYFRRMVVDAFVLIMSTLCLTYFGPVSTLFNYYDPLHVRCSLVYYCCFFFPSRSWEVDSNAQVILKTNHLSHNSIPEHFPFQTQQFGVATQESWKCISKKLLPRTHH